MYVPYWNLADCHILYVHAMTIVMLMTVVGGHEDTFIDWQVYFSPCPMLVIRSEVSALLRHARGLVTLDTFLPSNVDKECQNILIIVFGTVSTLIIRANGSVLHKILG